MAIDFIDFLHDSAIFKQIWFALAALEVLLISICPTTKT